MSDHNERPCKHCGSLLHHEDDCALATIKRENDALTAQLEAKEAEVKQSRATRRAFVELAKKKHKKDAEQVASLTSQLERAKECNRQMIDGKVHDDNQHSRVIAMISEEQATERRALTAERDEAREKLLSVTQELDFAILERDEAQQGDTAKLLAEAREELAKVKSGLEWVRSIRDAYLDRLCKVRISRDELAAATQAAVTKLKAILGKLSESASGLATNNAFAARVTLEVDECRSIVAGLGKSLLSPPEEKRPLTQIEGGIIDALKMQLPPEEKKGEATTFEAWLETLKAWQFATFPGETIEGVYRHLREEVEELGEHTADPMELADVLMLTFCLCFHQGVDPITALMAKHAINEAREWKKNDSGDWRHVKSITEGRHTKITINEVVHRELEPSNYTRIIPFSATIHAAKEDLSIQEFSIIQSAIVNAAHEIRRHRGEEEPFLWFSPQGNREDIATDALIGSAMRGITPETPAPASLPTERTDGERLDWMERHGVTKLNGLYPNIRAAIDAAMRTEEPEGREQG